MLRALVVTLTLLVATFDAEAAGRIALVIGNSAYQAVPALPNPVSDARAIGASFERLGFSVTVAEDLDHEGMRRALLDFGDRADGAEMAIIFYAGHGIEIDHQNYLIPIDARLATDRAVPFEAIPLDLAVAAVNGAMKLKLVLLDACRSNPFTAQMQVADASRSLSRGLSRVEPPSGTLVGYAAREGTVADDGEGEHSPYTAALIARLEIPGLEISLMFRQVRDDVLAATENQQEPFTYGSLPGESIYFVPPAGTSEGTKTNVATTPPASTGGEDRVAWDAIKDTTSVAILKTYIEKYPDSLYAGFAEARLAELEAGASAGGGESAPTAPAAGTFLGCFHDPNNPFDLDGYLERSAKNTPERCVEICRKKGYPYAGVQFGESCLCGTRYGQFGAADNCNYACTGNPSQVCGGYSSNSVYATGL